MSVEGLKLEAELEECCVCGLSSLELSSPEEYDSGAPPGQLPLRTMLLHLNNNKVVPSGRLCSPCIRRALEAYNFSTTLASKGPPPLSEKIRALRKRLYELTQKIDVFIVVGGDASGAAGAAGAAGAYGEEDVIMVERGALAAGARADRDAARQQRAPDARGDPVYQCSVCPLTFARMCEFRSHAASHPAGAAHACWTCGARAPSAAAAARHALQHAPPRAPRCHLCDTGFRSGSELRRHEARCAAVCPACGAALPSRAALRAHVVAQRAHGGAHGAHAALCAQCWLRCASREELAAHALEHHRDKHFVCGYKACILRFHTRSNLMAHIRKCHGGEPEPEPEEAPPAPAPAPAAPACSLCPKTFGSVSALKRHARVHRTADDAQDMDWTEEGEKVEYLEVETLEDLEQEVDA